MCEATYVVYTSKYFWKEDLKKIPEKIKFRFVSGARTSPISQAYSVYKYSFHHTTRTCSSSLVRSQSEVPLHRSVLVVHFPRPADRHTKANTSTFFLAEKERAQKRSKSFI
jgi:hypothetical protein